MANLQACSLFGLVALNLILLSIPSTNGLLVPRGGSQKAADPIYRRGSVPRHGAGAYFRRPVHHKGNLNIYTDNVFESFAKKSVNKHILFNSV